MQLLYAFAGGIGINQDLLVDVIEAVKSSSQYIKTSGISCLGKVGDIIGREMERHWQVLIMSLLYCQSRIRCEEFLEAHARCEIVGDLGT
jgi:hypothetical protein